MAGSSDSLSSVLSYALEHWVRLIAERRTVEVRRDGIPRKFCAFMDTALIRQEHLLPRYPFHDRVQERTLW